MASRSKKKRSNGIISKPHAYDPVPMRAVEHRDVKPSKGKSLGFGRDRARAYGDPVPAVGTEPSR